MSLISKIKTLNRQIREVYQNRSFVKSIIVGFVSLINQLFFLFLMTEILAFNYLLSSIFAFTITVFVNFNLQRYWSFDNKVILMPAKQMVKFMTLSILNLLVNSLLMYLFVDIFDVWYLFSQVIVTAVLFLFNFAIYKYYIFI